MVGASSARRQLPRTKEGAWRQKPTGSRCWTLTTPPSRARVDDALESPRVGRAAQDVERGEREDQLQEVPVQGADQHRVRHPAYGAVWRRSGRFLGSPKPAISFSSYDRKPRLL